MNMGVLLWLERKFKDRLKDGDLLFVYLIIYPVGRFLLEFIRLNSAEIAGINANQSFMLVVAVAAALVLLWRHRSSATRSKMQDQRQ
jgi:phosphatidylglycerol:prolipoprotein diacylglycerol transferase